MEIITVEEDHLKIIREISLIYPVIWREPPWHEDFWTAKDAINKINELFGKDSYLLIAALIKERLVGFSWGSVVNGKDISEIIGRHFPLEKIFFFINELAVVPDFRGKKVGQRLLERIMRLSARENISGWCLRTEKKALEARHVYIKAGFRDLKIKDKLAKSSTFFIKYV
jgi:GNAT superfamily N-acetyltransferase